MSREYEKKTYRYNRWAGNPTGTAQDPTRCVTEVSGGSMFSMYYQCGRKRGHGPRGLYCWQHARMIEESENGS